MRRTAILIMMVGFLFAYFSLEVAGIDLLIDAVGFLLVWNGVRVLARQENGFGFSGPVCLALVGICALQLFFDGTVGQVLAVLRAVAEVVLYAMMLRGFWRALRTGGGKADPVLAAVAFGGCMLAAVVPPLWFLIGAHPAVWTGLWWMATALHTAMLLELWRCAVVLHEKDAAG